jgi:hypothetical protein
VQPPTGPGLTRRALLTAVGGAGLLAAAGCNPFSTAGKTLTVTEEAPQPTAPMLGLIYKTRLHVQRLVTAVRTDKRDATVLLMLLNDRKAHLRALQDEYDRSIGQATGSTSPLPTTGVTMPSDPDEIIATIRGDAGDAQVMFTDAMSTASRYRAELYASIAACVATHRAVLA